MGKTHSVGRWEPKHKGYSAHLFFVVSILWRQQQHDVKSEQGMGFVSALDEGSFGNTHVITLRQPPAS